MSTLKPKASFYLSPKIANWLESVPKQTRSSEINRLLLVALALESEDTFSRVETLSVDTSPTSPKTVKTPVATLSSDTTFEFDSLVLRINHQDNQLIELTETVSELSQRLEELPGLWAFEQLETDQIVEMVEAVPPLVEAVDTLADRMTAIEEQLAKLVSRKEEVATN